MDEQGIHWFGLPHNFVNKLKIRRLRRKGYNPYELVAWYTMMHDLATQNKTFGQFNTDVESFEEACGVDIPDADDPDYFPWFNGRVKMWQAFQAAELVNIVGDVTDLETTFTVHVLDVSETNQPQPKALTAAERKRRQRERERAEAEAANGAVEPSVTKMSRENVTVTNVTTQTDRQTNPTYPQKPPIPPVATIGRTHDAAVKRLAAVVDVDEEMLRYKIQAHNKTHTSFSEASYLAAAEAFVTKLGSGFVPNDPIRYYLGIVKHHMSPALVRSGAAKTANESSLIAELEEHERRVAEWEAMQNA